MIFRIQMEVKYEDDITERAAFCHISNLISNHSNVTIDYSNVDEIIRKYRSKSSFSDQCSNDNLYRNVGNHDLFTPNGNKLDSVESIKKNENNNREKTNDNIMNYRCETKNNYINKFTCNNARLTSNEKVYHDKTTYCRPVLNYYNEQFIYKTMERNARLKNLVKKLVIAREREKETVSWNNFINDLKNRHGLNANVERDTLHKSDETEDYTPEIIDDYYKTRFSCVKSEPCSHLLQDFYRSYDEPYFYDSFDENKVTKAEFNTYLPCERNPYCYPTSSQARLLMNRRRMENQTSNQCHNNLNHVNSFKTVPRNNEECCKKFQKNNIDFNSESHVLKTTAVQTNVDSRFDFIHNYSQDKATYKTDDINNNNIQTNNSTISKNIRNHNSNLSQISLSDIDEKLKTLILSLNTFLDEIKFNKANRRKNKSHNTNNDNLENYYTISNIKSETKVRDNEKSNNNRISTIPEKTAINSNSNQCNLQPLSEINQILQILDVNNSKCIQNKKYKTQACTYIDFEVPTKDNTTEVTTSLSKPDSDDKEAIIEEINLPSDIPHRRMTIAVNTDPLSLLGLLRISTDTFKQLLSYMPHIDYCSYLSLLQFSQTRKIESRYVCNICGSDFNKPSQLSDHIRSHNLGKTRDCCVCNHVLDLASKYPGLFKCQYCGQLFARAYCCELHQKSCAKRFGKHHDVGSNLVLLR